MNINNEVTVVKKLYVARSVTRRLLGPVYDLSLSEKNIDLVNFNNRDKLQDRY